MTQTKLALKWRKFSSVKEKSPDSAWRVSGLDVVAPPLLDFSDCSVKVIFNLDGASIRRYSPHPVNGASVAAFPMITPTSLLKSLRDYQLLRRRDINWSLHHDRRRHIDGCWRVVHRLTVVDGGRSVVVTRRVVVAAVIVATQVARPHPVTTPAITGIVMATTIVSRCTMVRVRVGASSIGPNRLRHQHHQKRSQNQRSLHGCFLLSVRRGRN